MITASVRSSWKPSWRRMVRHGTKIPTKFTLIVSTEANWEQGLQVSCQLSFGFAISKLLSLDVFERMLLLRLSSDLEPLPILMKTRPSDRHSPSFRADLVIRPHQHTAKSGALYFVTSNEKLSEALLLQMEADKLKRDEFRIIALIEDSEMRMLSKKKFQRAQKPFHYRCRSSEATKMLR